MCPSRRPRRAPLTVASNAMSWCGFAFAGPVTVVVVAIISIEPASHAPPTGRGTPRRSVVPVAGHRGAAGLPYVAPDGIVSTATLGFRIATVGSPNGPPRSSMPSVRFRSVRADVLLARRLGEGTGVVRREVVAEVGDRSRCTPGSRAGIEHRAEHRTGHGRPSSLAVRPPSLWKVLRSTVVDPRVADDAATVALEGGVAQHRGAAVDVDGLGPPIVERAAGDRGRASAQVETLGVVGAEGVAGVVEERLVGGQGAALHVDAGSADGGVEDPGARQVHGAAAEAEVTGNGQAARAGRHRRRAAAWSR